MIETMNKAAAELLRKEINDAMEVIAKKHGLLYLPKGARYLPAEGEFNYPVKFQTSGLNGEDRELAEFKLTAPLYGVNVDMYKATFSNTKTGETFELIGFDTSRPKFPVRARNVKDGTILLYTERVIPRLVKREEVAS